MVKHLFFLKVKNPIKSQEKKRDKENEKKMQISVTQLPLFYGNYGVQTITKQKNDEPTENICVLAILGSYVMTDLYKHQNNLNCTARQYWHIGEFWQCSIINPTFIGFEKTSTYRSGVFVCFHWSVQSSFFAFHWSFQF